MTAPVALAIDLGGSNLALRALDHASALDREHPIPDATAAEELDFLLTAVEDAAGLMTGPVAACVLASAPSLDAGGVVTRWPTRPHWSGLPIRDALEAVVKCPVLVEDDGNAAAVAEAAAHRARDLVYIGLGTGVGGGLVLDGRLHRGAQGAAGEIGHMPIAGRGSPRCSCGRDGCLQAFASGLAVLRSVFGPQAAAPDGPRLRARLEEDDPLARGALAGAADALARAVTILAELVNPRLVCLGGGFAAAFPELVEMTTAESQRHRRSGQDLPLIVPAAHGARASLEGAAILARQLLAERTPVGGA